MRDPRRVLQTTWLTMIALQTIGTVDTQRKMPAPKQYVAIGVLWGVLFLLADTGLRKLAAQLSILVLLAATVLGPFGARLVTLLQMVSTNFAVPQIQPPPTATGPGGTFGGAARPGSFNSAQIPRVRTNTAGYNPGPVAPFPSETA